jgi:hypothetical protein
MSLSINSVASASQRESEITLKVIRLNAPGVKPMLNLDNCSLLVADDQKRPKLVLKNVDEKLVFDILEKISPNHGLHLFKIAPNELMWWLRTLGSVSIQTLGVAVHETNHAVDALATACNSGFATYYLNGKTITTEHRYGDTPRYSVLRNSYPDAARNSKIGSRFTQYVEGNGKTDGSDFSILLDEFLAYSGAAELELKIASDESVSWLFDPAITSLDGNFGGAVDFMLYVLSYLKEIRTKYPDVYAKLLIQPRLLETLQVVWTNSEVILNSGYRCTTIGQQGGRLAFFDNVLSFVYSDEYLKELNFLGISHKSRTFWNQSYFKKND